MRILILANKDLASNLAINLLLNAAPQHTYSILLSSKVGSTSDLPAQLNELAFFEQHLFNDIIFQLANKLDKKGSHCLDSFDGLKQKGIAVANISHINQAAGVTAVAAFKPNLIVSIRFGQILQQPIIDIPEFGVINLHSGLLPNYRGVMATFWAMLNQETEYGTSLHYIDSNKIDAGNIISMTKHPLDCKKSYLYNVLSLYSAGAKQIVDSIKEIEQGLDLKSKPMDINRGNYFSHPDDKALNRFNEQGNRLLDYSEIVEFAKWYYQTPFDLT
ncbi:MAG: hypothetical protein Alis3KO_03650 [Aliiglaciecola sp.]